MLSVIAVHGGAVQDELGSFILESRQRGDCVTALDVKTSPNERRAKRTCGACSLDQ